MLEEKIKDSLPEEATGSGEDRFRDMDSQEITEAHKLNPSQSKQDDDRLELEEILDRKQDREQRKGFAGKIFIFIICWMVFIGAVISLQGFELIRLSDAVVIALLTTTTANVIGLMICVMRYLFPRNRTKQG